VSACVFSILHPPLNCVLTRFRSLGRTVSQRSRRFAFVSFRTIEQAISAKQRMSRVHPWKSAISFAHKESQSHSTSGSPGLPLPGGLHPFGVSGFNITRPISEMSQQQLAQYVSALSAAGIGIGMGSPPLFDATDDHANPPRSQSAAPTFAGGGGLTAAMTRGATTNPSPPLGGGGGGGGGYPELTQPRPTHAQHFQQQQQQQQLDADGDAADVFGPGAGAGIVRPISTGSTGDVAAPNGTDFMDERFLLMMQRQLAVSNKVVVNVDPAAEYRATPPLNSTSQKQELGTEAVLRRLCDDTYVPTQPWPVNWDVDAFFCSAVVAQLQQFGGTTTISKLRGFLRSRVNATDNIKSVPLKAMLSGYPAFFVVRGNQVGLTPALLGQATVQHHHHQNQNQHQHQQQYHLNVDAHVARASYAGDYDLHQYGGSGGGGGVGTSLQHNLMQQQPQQAVSYEDFVNSAYHQQGVDASENNAVFGMLNTNFSMAAASAGLNSNGMGNASSADQQSSFSYGL